MAILTTSYRNKALHSMMEIKWNDVTFAITSGIIVRPLTDNFPPLNVPGDIIWQKTVDIPPFPVAEYYLRVQNEPPYAYFTSVNPIPVLPEDLVIDSVIVTPMRPGVLGHIKINASGSGTLRYQIESGPKQISPDFDVSSGNRTCKVSRLEDSYTKSKNVIVPFQEDLQFALDKVDESANGKTDGKVIVNIYQGSGHYRIHFTTPADFSIDLTVDSVYQYIRSNLAPGIYTVEVTDLSTNVKLVQSITITEPPPPDPDPDPTEEIYGSIFYVPVSNSIQFIVQSVVDCSIPQALDNVLLADQRYKGIEKARYSQKFNRCDKPTIQFNSDFSAHLLELRKCSDGEVQQVVATAMVQQNVGKTQSFEAYLTNHPDVVGQSRIYFATNAIPVPVAINDNFSISNNADGFNGNYLAVNIGIDIVTNKQYIVINKAYGASSPTSPATTIFKNQTINFNVYEATIGFLDIPDGEYYFKLTGTSINEVVAISEPISVKEEHAGTIKVECRDNRNGKGGMTWLTGYTAMYRIEGLFGHSRVPGGDTTLNRNANNSPNVVDGKPTRPINVWVGLLPPYLFEKLGVAFKCKFQIINGITVVATEFNEVEYRPNTLFGSANIKVEQVDWFGPFTNNGIGTVVDGGYITTETGFLKR